MPKKYLLKDAIRKLFNLINLEKNEIKQIYIFALLNGAIILSLPLGIQAIINLMFGVTVSTSLVVMISLVVLGVLLNGIFQIMQMRVIERLQQRVFTRLTFAYAYRIPKIDLHSIDDYYLPELVNRFFDTASLQKGLSKLLLDLPTASIQVLFGLILLGFYHPIFILFGVFLLIVGLIIFYLSSSKGFTSSVEESEYKYKVASWLEELSRSVKTFKSHQQTDLHLRRTDDLVSGYLGSRDNHFAVLLFQYRVIISFKVIITAAMLVVGAFLFINQIINLGQFIATEIIIITIINAIEKLIISLEIVYDVLTSLEKINKVLEKPQDDESGIINSTNWPATSGIKVSAKNLQFSYSGKSSVLKNVNLEVEAGQKVCIKGTDESGKTTLLKVLTGMWRLYSGQLTFNDTPLRNISSEILRKEVGFYFSEEEIFSGTILENITLGYKATNISELNQIIKLVGLSDLIAKRQDGLNSLLDPQGKRLSSNVIKKILFARCMFKKPSLILLEEEFMQGIDDSSKIEIINYLTSPTNAATLIAVSNNEDFAAMCDKVYTIQSGTIK